MRKTEYLRKTIAISLLTTLLFSQAGYYVYYSIQLHRAKEAAKREILAGLPGYMLETIAHSDAMQWEEEEEEFYLDGNMYDVVSAEQKDGKTIYHCINDKKEEEILKQFADATAGAHQPLKSKNGKQSIKLPLGDYTCTDMLQLAPPVSPGSRKDAYYNAIPVSLYKEISIPPPKA